MSCISWLSIHMDTPSFHPFMDFPSFWKPPWSLKLLTLTIQNKGPINIINIIKHGALFMEPCKWSLLINHTTNIYPPVIGYMAIEAMAQSK